MRDLRDFIKLLRDRGWLAVIDTPVDPCSRSRRSPTAW